MGKYIVMYLIPAAILLPLVWWGVRQWYLHGYKHNVAQRKKIDKATLKYERELDINQPKKKARKK